jgi:hypothetical protein
VVITPNRGLAGPGIEFDLRAAEGFRFSCDICEEAGVGE